VLLAVSDANNPGDDDIHKKQLFESWGYRVELIDDDASHAAYAAAMSTNDAAYVSASVSADTLAGKLASTVKGVVNEEGLQNPWLGTSSDAAWTAGASLTVVDNTHYITALFPAGQLPIYAVAMEGLTAAGTLAGDLQTLANWDAQPGLAVLDKGGLLHDGISSAPGRRVMLPLGRHQTTGFDWNYLDSNGRLLVQRALEWAVQGGQMPPPVYVEAHGTWKSDAEKNWRITDLSGYPFLVPPNAVLEVAISNRRADRERWGGIRTVGSGLQRRFELHEAEAGGREVVVMHVQADGSGRIEHYAEDRDDVEFTLLGYWNRGSYVETLAGFKAGVGAAWRDHALSAYGVAAGQVAEVVIVNTNESNERRVGIRSDGSSLNRILELHEAEAGGADIESLHVRTDARSTIQWLHSDVSDAHQFHLLGWWD